MRDLFRLEFRLERAFGKARYYAENTLAQALRDIIGGQSLTHEQVRILAAHFEVRVREGQMEPVAFETLEAP